MNIFKEFLGRSRRYDMGIVAIWVWDKVVIVLYMIESILNCIPALGRLNRVYGFNYTDQRPVSKATTLTWVRRDIP